MKSLDKKIMEAAKRLEAQTVARRRDFHRYAETGWTEFRTASSVIETLRGLGYTVQFGAEVMEEAQMMGVPAKEVLSAQMKRAIAQGANPALVEKMAGGKTGVVAVMDFARSGKTVAFRFDMDCNDIAEAKEETHRPYREGFASVNDGCMHACGHDGHTAAGLAVAAVLAELREELSGRVKFIFQPAEEGVRGAKAMAAKGVASDVDYLLAAHLMTPEVGYLAYDVQGFYATTKFDVKFTGMPAHAGALPENGKNALLAAANAAVNLQAISRHGGGDSRVNVGVLQAGSGRNVIAAEAVMKAETRGVTAEVNDYLYQRAGQIIQNAAAMYGTKAAVTQVGSAAGIENSLRLSSLVGKVAERLGTFRTFGRLRDIGGSEDCSYFMEQVQQRGGQAAYLIIGASLAAPNHNQYFDFDESVLTREAQLLSAVAGELLSAEK